MSSITQFYPTEMVVTVTDMRQVTTTMMMDMKHLMMEITMLKLVFMVMRCFIMMIFTKRQTLVLKEMLKVEIMGNIYQQIFID